MISAGPTHARRRPGLSVLALAAALIAALAAAVVGAHVQPAGHGTVVTGHVGVGTVAPRTLPAASNTPPDLRQVHPNAVEGIAGLVLYTAYALGALAVVLIIARFLLGLFRRPKRGARVGRVAAEEFAASDLVEQMASAVDDAIDALDADGPAADAIIQCWQRLVSAAEQSGVPPLASDTPEETINRVFAAGQVHAGPLRTLAELYREARFSQHVMGAAEVATARAALSAILDDLKRPADAVG